MGKTALLAGFGMQGQAALYDLIRYGDLRRIVVVDNRPDLLGLLSRYSSPKVQGRRLDACDAESLARLMREADVAVEALPSVFALPLGELAADAGVALVSSMYYLDPGERDAASIAGVKGRLEEIDRKAREKGIVILSEFGLDPGLDLILGSRALGELDEIHEFRTYGAGIPASGASDNPLQYKFSWSAIGVMKAYHRSATVIRGGQAVTIDASQVFEPENCHMLNVEEAGLTLECFPNGNCLHYAELFGIRGTVQEMGRYTCRYPGHCAFWNKMAKCGFLDPAPIRVGDTTVAPIEFTAELLGSQRQFQYRDDEGDLTLVRIEVRGKRGGETVRILYQLLDTRDLETGFTSMQRTVGFTLSLGAQLILEGKLAPGLRTPLDVPFEEVIPRLARHNIHVFRREIPEGF